MQWCNQVKKIWKILIEKVVSVENHLAAESRDYKLSNKIMIWKCLNSTEIWWCYVV